MTFTELSETLVKCGWWQTSSNTDKQYQSAIVEYQKGKFALEVWYNLEDDLVTGINPYLPIVKG